MLLHPVPSFKHPFKPQLQPRVIEVKPFSFESQTQEMFQRREQRLHAVIEEEEKVTNYYCFKYSIMHYIGG